MMNKKIDNQDYIINMLQTGIDFISSSEYINGCIIRYDTISCLRYRPLIINISFACEVLLKCYYFISFDKELKSEHNLFNIYREIKSKNPSFADLIFNKFNNLFSKGPMHFNKFEKTLALGGNHFCIDRYLYELRTDYDFESSNNINNTFDKQNQQKRYQWNRYEDVYFLYILSNCLKLLIAEYILEKFQLTEKEKNYIKSIIKPME